MPREINRDRKNIIEKAFEIWGKTGFFNTSLKNVSQKFNITKQGLLRHFRTKENLLKELADYFFSNYYSMLEKAIEIDIADLDLESFIKFYIKTHFSFFLENLSFFSFFVSPISKKYFAQNNFISEYRIKEEEILKRLFLKSNCWLKDYDPFFILRYIYILMFFFIVKYLKSCVTGKRDFSLPLNKVDEKDKIDLINRVTDIVMNGFAKDRVDIDFEKIEREYEVKLEEIPKRDKIFNAITKVVSETSIWDASIEKIAKELGVNKSTIFYYFKNKKEMFDELLYEEISTITNIFLSKLNRDSNFYELFYANMVVDRSYFLKDINTLYYFDWLHFQKIKGFNINSEKSFIKIKDLISKKYFFLIEAINNNTLKTYDLTLEDLIGLLNMEIVKDLSIALEYNKKVKLSDLRALYLIFLYGIKNF